MNPLLLLKWWRELAIVALMIFSASAVRSCSSAKDEVTRVKAEDSALAENQRRQNEEKASTVQQASDNALKEVRDENAHLRNDTRVASLVCDSTPRRRPVPVAANTSGGAHAETPTELPPAPARDFGPDIDALTREADEAVVRCNALVDWINSTR